MLDYTVTDGTTVKDRLGWISAPDLRPTLRATAGAGAPSRLNYSQGEPASTPSSGFIGGVPGSRLGSYTTHDLSVTCRAPREGSITIGVNDAGDRYPASMELRGRPRELRAP